MGSNKLSKIVGKKCNNESSDAGITNENVDEVLKSPDLSEKSSNFSSERGKETNNQLENVTFDRLLNERLKEQEEKHENEIEKIKQDYQAEIDDIVEKFNNQLETLKSDISGKKEQLKIKSQINGQLLDKVNSLTKQKQQSEQDKNDLKVDVAMHESKIFLLEIQIKNLEDKLVNGKK